MKFFIDTADIGEIRDLARTGMIDGVTTNPTLVAKTDQPFKKLIGEICRLVNGPVSAEVAASDYATMLAEARELHRIAHNVAIKLPLTPDGLKACRLLSAEGITTNVTLCFSAGQAILAAKAGATYVSPFVGRLDDAQQSGIGLIAEIMEIFEQYDSFRTEVLVASVRHVGHLIEAAKLGAHVATVPPKILRELYQHPLTDKGLAQFAADWQATGQTILEK